MTICVAVSVGEGLVMAADSATTLEGELQTPTGKQHSVLKTFIYGNKLTQIKDYPIGIMSWGLASIEDRTILSLIMEFEHSYPDMKLNPGYTVRSVADDFLKFFEPKYKNYCQSVGTNPTLGLYIGGYSASQFFSEAFHVEWPATPRWTVVRLQQANGRPNFGANWFGQKRALTRLVLGYDLEQLEDLLKRGVNKKTIEDSINSQVAHMPLVFDGMPIQDAIDFAAYATAVTIGWFRFAIGASLCGGDVDIAVITPSGFHWAQRKEWTIKGARI